MNNDGIHSLLDAGVMTVSRAPSQGARRVTEEGARAAALAADPEAPLACPRARDRRAAAALWQP